jgi:hypothetical protein
VPDAESRENQSWLSLLREQGEDDLGGGLRRLAQLAAAAHRQQVAEQAQDDAHAGTADEFSAIDQNQEGAL